LRNQTPNAAFGSKSDIARRPVGGRYSLKGGHSSARLTRPDCARSRFMQRSKIKLFLDHLVGARKHHRWHVQAEFFGEFETNDQLEFDPKALRL
jgi:hypothetical protein